MELDLPSFLKNPFTRNVSDRIKKILDIYIFFIYLISILKYLIHRMFNLFDILIKGGFHHGKSIGY